MNNLSENERSFLALLRAGLWGHEVQLLALGRIDFNSVYKIAEEQSVAGILAAGIEKLVAGEIPKDIVLTFVGAALQLEKRNMEMNAFIQKLWKKLTDKNIKAFLIKGQGIACCYERPLWRACGDVDLLLDCNNYLKAKKFFSLLADRQGVEIKNRLHMDYSIGPWEVELHGSLRNGLWSRMDKVIDEAQSILSYRDKYRKWYNGDVVILIPAVDEDVVFVFTHILQHFFMGGIGLRQVCDWSRLLSSYKSEVDIHLLESRLWGMGLMSEWKAFAAFAVNILGMPVEDMPLYSPSRKWVRKSNRILAFILETGNFGHNRDNSYYHKYPYLVYKAISLWRISWDSMRLFMIFPLDAIKVWCNRFWVGIQTIAKGK